MSIQANIEAKLATAMQPVHMEVSNESSQHNVPPGSESHFKVVLVSAAFDGKNLLARHRLVNEVLADELKNQIHALSLHTYTAQEWQVREDAPQSPPCMGGGKG